jgi:hypothetical protein
MAAAGRCGNDVRRLYNPSAKLVPLMTLYKPLASLFLLVSIPCLLQGQTPASAPPPTVFGYADFSAQAKIEEKFLAVPDAKLAGPPSHTWPRHPKIIRRPNMSRRSFAPPASIPGLFPTAF